ncbi:MAG: MFS family permease [Bradymonadia bacterium]|jgi:MFS family permease
MLELVRNNRTFRRLWFADIVSLFGDWFNTIAIIALVQRLSDSPLAVALVFAMKMLGYAVCSPIAGVIADRVDRRRLMIASDLLRALVVLGFLFVRSEEWIPLIYLLTFLQVGISSVFRPARSASLPNIVAKDDLLNAAALMSVTWSTLLAVGAGLGGVASAFLGTDAVFIIDAASYIVSAAMLSTIRFPSPAKRTREGSLIGVAARDIIGGWRYMVRRGDVGRIALAKACWAVGGSGLVFMLTQIGERLTPENTALGVGILLGFRGVGTGVGPIVARLLLPEQRRWPVALGFFVVTSGLIYGSASMLISSFWVIVPVVLAHALSGANWVLSSVMLQTRAEDEVRGRVFATEWVILSTVNALMITSVGFILERGWATLPQAMVGCSGVMVVAGLLWLAFVPAAERRSEDAREAAL